MKFCNLSIYSHENVFTQQFESRNTENSNFCLYMKIKYTIFIWFLFYNRLRFYRTYESEGVGVKISPFVKCSISRRSIYMECKTQSIRNNIIKVLIFILFFAHNYVVVFKIKHFYYRSQPIMTVAWLVVKSRLEFDLNSDLDSQISGQFG